MEPISTARFRMLSHRTMSDDPGPDKRAQRAVLLIAAALTAIVLAGVLYLRAVGPASTGVPTPTAIPMMSGPYSATYDFITPSSGWALVLDYGKFSTTLSTRFWIFKTTDGARHWQQLYQGSAEGGQTYIHFFDEQHGLAYAGISYRTVDGGAHWQSIETPGPMPYITFASPTVGWAEDFDALSHSQRLYMTTDGGSTWKRLPTDLPGAAVLEPIFEIQSSAFRESGEGWLGAGYVPSPIVYVTVNAGGSWQMIPIPSPGAASSAAGYLTSARLVPGGAVLVLVSDDSAHVLGAFLSGNRGVSWRQVAFPTAVSTSDDLVLVDATNWWLLLSGHIWTTPNGGLNWMQVAPVDLPDGWRFEGARVLDKQHAWWSLVSSAKSTNSALAMTSDGGEHWKMVNVPQPQ